MMINVRAKGATGETKVRDELRELTGLKWERVPGSGALDPKHMLKGDLYVPGESNLFCVEVKSYKDCHIDHTLITGKTSQLIDWVEQAIRQGKQVDKAWLLIFKHDRSKLYAAYEEVPAADYPYLFVSKNGYNFFISLLEDYIKNNNPKFIK